jgi:hypothetical protein
VMVSPAQGKGFPVDRIPADKVDTVLLVRTSEGASFSRSLLDLSLFLCLSVCLSLSVSLSVSLGPLSPSCFTRTPWSIVQSAGRL